MIQLKSTQKVRTWGIQAILRERIPGHPFTAFFKAALEFEEEGIETTPAAVGERLHLPFPEQGVKNLLSRLEKLGFFETRPEEQDAFDLTELGRRSAEEEAYWTVLNGVFEIKMVASRLVNQKVVQFSKQDRRISKDQLRKVPKRLKEIEAKNLKLKVQEYLFEEMERLCYFEDPKDEPLSVEAEGEAVTLKILDYENRFEDWTEDRLREYLLFHSDLNYLPETGKVHIPFDPLTLDFKRSVKLTTVEWEEETFESVTLKDIPFAPQDQEAAQEWYEALLLRQTTNTFSPSPNSNNSNGPSKKNSPVKVDSRWQTSAGRKSCKSTFTEKKPSTAVPNLKPRTT